MRFNSNGRVVNHPKLHPHAYFATWCNSSTGTLTFMVFLVRETERFRLWDLGAGFRTPTQLDELVSTVNLAYMLYQMILLDRPQVELQDAVITCNLFDVSPYRCPEFEGRMGESESPIKDEQIWRRLWDYECFQYGAASSVVTARYAQRRVFLRYLPPVSLLFSIITTSESL